MTKILSFKVENIQRTEEVSVDVNGQTIVIGGKNEHGKTSTLRAVAMALGGKALVPAEPVRRGQTEGCVEVALEGYDVKLWVDAERETKLEVRAADGKKVPNAQSFLNELFSKSAFDPGEFVDATDTERVEMLKKAVGLDFGSLDADITKALYARRDAKAVGASARARCEYVEVNESLPTEFEPTQELSNTITNAKANAARVEALKSESARLSIRLAEIENELGAIDQKDGLEQMQERLEQATAKNVAIQQNNEARKLHRELDGCIKHFKKTEAEVNRLRLEKRQLIESVQMPIEGLDLSEDGLRFEGTLWDQVAESRQWDIATAIAFELNQNGIVIMKCSGGLDSDSRERVRARAASKGVQLFMEVFDTPDDVMLVIEEGRVKENRMVV